MIDLSRLTFIDSSGLWAITLTQRICRRRGLGLLIRPGPERVQSVFEVTGPRRPAALHLRPGSGPPRHV